MWKFEDEKEGIVITGTRQQLKEQLNIFMVGISGED